MEELFYLAAGAIIAAVPAAIGFAVGRGRNREKAEDRGLTRAEKDDIRRSRREMEEEQRAFQALIGYNPETAYGIADGYFDYSGRK